MNLIYLLITLTGMHVVGFGLGQAMSISSSLDGAIPAIAYLTFGSLITASGWALRTTFCLTDRSWLPCSALWLELLALKLGLATFTFAYVGGTRNGSFMALLPLVIFAVAVFFWGREKWLLILGFTTNVFAFFWGMFASGDGDPLTPVVLLFTGVLVALAWGYNVFFTEMQRDISETLAVMRTPGEYRMDLKAAMGTRRYFVHFVVSSKDARDLYNDFFNHVERMVSAMIEVTQRITDSGDFTDARTAFVAQYGKIKGEVERLTSLATKSQAEFEVALQGGEVTRVLESFKDDFGLVTQAAERWP